MVESIPASGAVVIVHSVAMRRYVEQMIFDLRGDQVAKLCRVHSISSYSDLARLQGVRMPIRIDHAAYLHMDARVIAYLEQLERTVELMFGAGAGKPIGIAKL
ncbi:MAG TPA: hypothetical protein VGV39_04680 [Mesorhizobium sp.]|jgi:hypothetical protein|uniref:hypothetical protein n=1 Tax=Mesorhizobium sp. TaxID=1871066 RepID=UPI002DDD9DC3|nr:hypothetical protein [Mesorhizobium sp.]HEV2502344.1 hypothetical protein [Mesorhizobium sp.]